jgi:phosphatidylglycerophosphatase C
VFDLDGTLTWHDTLVPYLLAALRVRPLRALRLWRLPAQAARFVVDRDRGRLKSGLIRAVLGGLSREAIAALTRSYLDARLARLVRPDALAAVARHRARGDWLVLLSASTDFYVRELGARLGFDEVICTETVWNGGRLDGRLATANRRGREKTRCVAALRLRHEGAPISAYANAASDLDHLVAADAATLVNGSRRLERRARRLGLGTAQWR